MTIIFHVHITPLCCLNKIILCTKLQILFNRDDEMRDDTMCEGMMDGVGEWFVKAFSMKMKNNFFDVKMMKLYSFIYIECQINFSSMKYLYGKLFAVSWRRDLPCFVNCCCLWAFSNAFVSFYFIFFQPTQFHSIVAVKLLPLNLF